MRLMHVQAVEVSQGERDEGLAKTILRSNVLMSPGQASQAWSLLIEEGQRLIRTRAEANLSRLLGVLSSAGVPVDAPTSYRDDIRRLRDHSDRVARMLADHADIRLGSATVRIQAALCARTPRCRGLWFGADRRRAWGRQIGSPLLALRDHEGRRARRSALGCPASSVFRVWAVSETNCNSIAMSWKCSRTGLGNSGPFCWSMPWMRRAWTSRTRPSALSSEKSSDVRTDGA